MQQLSWPGGSYAVDVQLRITADGMVYRVSSLAGEELASARAGFQYAVSAADKRRSGGCGWRQLHRSGRPRKNFGEEVSLAIGYGYYELLNVSSVIWYLGGAALRALRFNFRFSGF